MYIETNPERQPAVLAGLRTPFAKRERDLGEGVLRRAADGDVGAGARAGLSAVSGRPVFWLRATRKEV